MQNINELTDFINFRLLKLKNNGLTLTEVRSLLTDQWLTKLTFCINLTTYAENLSQTIISPAPTHFDFGRDEVFFFLNIVRSSKRFKGQNTTI